MAIHKRKMRNLLLDWRYQLSHTAVVVVIATALTAGLGYFWYGQVRETSRIIEVKALGSPSVSDEEVAEIQANLARQDSSRLLVLIGFGILFAGGLAASGILMTHRVAGPLFKISKHMRDIGAGRVYPLWPLRKGDQLQDFWQDFASMHNALRDGIEKDISLFDNAMATMERHMAQTGTRNSSEMNAQMEALRVRRTEKARMLEEAGPVTQRLRRPRPGDEPAEDEQA